MSVAKERAERSAAPRWRNQLQRSSTLGSNTKERMMLLVSCFRAREADHSVPTRFSISWPNTLRLRRRYVLRSPKKNVSPHVLRHAAAMELLQAGVDRSMI